MMQAVAITEPLTLRPGELDVPTRFRVTQPIDGPALILRGNVGEAGYSDRCDGWWPAIELDGVGHSGGVLLDRLNEAHLTSIYVSDVRGTAVEAIGVRNGAIDKLTATRCIADVAVKFSGPDGMDDSNELWIGRLGVWNSLARRYLSFDGQRMTLHTPWKHARRS